MADAIPASFSSRSTAKEVTEGIHMTGKVVIVTGASSGIGEETARMLALRGATVVLAVRNTEAGEQSKARIQEELAKAPKAAEEAAPAERLIVLPLDLASLSSVRSFAENFEGLNLPLHVLINNAGVMMCPFTRTADGHEMQFGTNHLGHFLLTSLLLPKLKATASSSSSPSRIVILSSHAHNFVYSEGIRFGHIDEEAGYTAMGAYGQSKLANILHARELARRLQEEGVENVTVNSLHPGAIMTNLGRHILPDGSFLAFLLKPVFQLFLKTIPQGAATTCVVATSPALEKVSGKYFSDCQVAKTSAFGEDDEMAKKLWEETEAMLK